MMALAQVSAMTVDSVGVEHVTYQQSYDDVPVFGGQVKMHYNPEDDRRTITGKSLDTISVDTIPTVSADAAGSIAQELAGQTVSVRNSTLYVFNEYLINKNKPDQSVLVWEIEVYNREPLVHDYYYINALTGESVYQIAGIYDAVNRLVYDCSYGAYTGDCYIDALDGTTGYTYGRSEGQAARGANPNFFITSDTDTDDLYDLLGQVYNYYTTTFGRDGANNAGGMGDGTYYGATTTTTLTYLDYYYSSYNDYTSCPNAFFDGVGTLRFCEGLVTNDIAGHEYAHAVNYFSILDETGAPAGLAYTNETGALNEANSDVFGEALEYYATGTNDWLMGADSVIGTLRDMADPTTVTYVDDNGASVPYPDRYNSEQFYCGTGDSGGVHYNSSVVNKAAYLMAEGGSFNGCTVTALGRAKEEAIFYRAQTTYFTTTTDFNGAYTALLAACADLYSDEDCQEVEKALRAVELDQAGYCSGETGTTPDCISVDSAPTVLAVTSTTANGYYKKGTTVDIDVTFSETVTSTGDVTVTLETGSTDRTCTFTIADATTGTCDYTVQAGDTSADLAVKSITGTIVDSSGDSLTVTTPTTNLSAGKQIVIDTTKPTVPTKLKIYSSKKKTKRIKTINPDTYTKIVKGKSLHPYMAWSAVSGVTKYYVKFTDKKMSRAKLLNSRYKQTSRNRTGKVKQIGKKYYLYMLLQDQAKNRSKVKTLLTYKAE
ncbi:MAG TPA: hypothetical protein DEG44_04970 [Candidatus Kerfeldbacteria bacterium]|nr:hypothetical protein [Candidatus Kerfeldbacteria bacterium]